MELRLKQEDIEVLDSGKTISLNNPSYGYVGGDFSTNPNDYVEVLIYDTNDNFLESSIADVDDYYFVDGAIKLNTGTILRKMGYDRGRYVVKYNFLRKLAGSDETLLVDSDGIIYTDFHRMDGGRLMSGTEHSDTAVNLFVKENKYFIQEISPSRTEIRVVPQNISDGKYISDFLKVQTSKKRINISSGAKFEVDAQGTSLAGDSLSLVFNENVNIPNQAIGGTVSLNGAFIESIVDLTPPDPTEARAEEIESIEVFPRFIISDDSSGRYEKGDRNFEFAYNYFKDLLESDSPTDTGNIAYYDDDPQGLLSIKYVDVDTYNLPTYGYITGQPVAVTLKSISAKPQQTTFKYTWEISGYDRDSGGSYDKLTTADVTINNANDLKISGTDLKEITINLNSKDCRFGVKLTIERASDGIAKSILIPCCIKSE